MSQYFNPSPRETYIVKAETSVITMTSTQGTATSRGGGRYLRVKSVAVKFPATDTTALKNVSIEILSPTSSVYVPVAHFPSIIHDPNPNDTEFGMAIKYMDIPLSRANGVYTWRFTADNPTLNTIVAQWYILCDHDSRWPPSSTNDWVNPIPLP